MIATPHNVQRIITNHIQHIINTVHRITNMFHNNLLGGLCGPLNAHHQRPATRIQRVNLELRNLANLGPPQPASFRFAVLSPETGCGGGWWFGPVDVDLVQATIPVFIVVDFRFGWAHDFVGETARFGGEGGNLEFNRLVEESANFIDELVHRGGGFSDSSVVDFDHVISVFRRHEPDEEFVRTPDFDVAFDELVAW